MSCVSDVNPPIRLLSHIFLLAWKSYLNWLYSLISSPAPLLLLSPFPLPPISLPALSSFTFFSFVVSHLASLYPFSNHLLLPFQWSCVPPKSDLDLQPLLISHDYLSHWICDMVILLQWIRSTRMFQSFCGISTCSIVFIFFLLESLPSHDFSSNTYSCVPH